MNSTMSKNDTSQKNSATAYAFFRKYHSVFSWIVIAVAIAMTLVLGLIAFESGEGKKLPLTTRLYLALQLLTLESGSLTEVSHVGWKLEVARWSGVVAAFGTIFNTLIAVFATRIHSLLLRRMSEHAVVIGAGQAGIQLVTDLIAEGYRVIVIESEAGNAAMPALIQRGANELYGDGRDVEILEAAAIHAAAVVIIVAGTDTRNLEVAAAVTGLAKRRNYNSPSQHCYVHIVDQRIAELYARQASVIPKHKSGTNERRIEVRTFSRFVNSVRLLLSQSPLDRQGISMKENRQVHLVIVDLAVRGEALLMHSLAIGHFANTIPLAVTVIDESASQKEELLTERFPEIHKCGQLTFVDGDLHDQAVRQRLNGLLADSTQIVTLAVCCEDSQAALTQSMDLMPLLTQYNNTVYANLGEDENASVCIEQSHLDTMRLVSFGNPNNDCSLRAVLRQDLDHIARSLHAAYVSKRLTNGDSEQDYPAMRPWDELDVELQELNRQQADHLPVKLRALGYQMLPISSGSQNSRFDATDVQIEALAIAEHNRWCASRRLSGWQYGESRNDRLKTHPDLVSWEELSEETKEYDRQPIRLLPTLLSQIGYVIVPV